MDASSTSSYSALVTTQAERFGVGSHSGSRAAKTRFSSTAADAAVLDAYGFDSKKDVLEQLLALNLEVAARIAGGQPVTPPGVPAAYGDPSALITDDCIRP